MKYGHIDENTGKLLGWYTSEIHKVIPTPNIEVSEEEWQVALDSGANHYNGLTFDTVDFRSEGEIRDSALAKIEVDIKTYSDRVANKPWYYAPKDANFHLDLDSATKMKARGANKNTSWKTADKETNGVKAKRITFSKQELSDYADATMDRAELLFEVREFHIESVQDIYLNPLKTAEDILKYDFTKGWSI